MALLAIAEDVRVEDEVLAGDDNLKEECEGGDEGRESRVVKTGHCGGGRIIDC